MWGGTPLRLFPTVTLEFTKLKGSSMVVRKMSPLFPLDTDMISLDTRTFGKPMMLLDELPFSPNWSRMPSRQFAPPTSHLPKCLVNTLKRTSKRPTMIVRPEMAVQGTLLPNLGSHFLTRKTTMMDMNHSSCRDILLADQTSARQPPSPIISPPRRY